MTPSKPSLAASASALSSFTTSHTASDQWQSFEMRMRYRRALRCVLRAEVALEAGFPDDARVALDEARRLDSAAPTFEVLEAAVAARAVAPVDSPRVLAPARSRRRLALAALALLASLAVPGSRFPVPGSRFPVPGSGSGSGAPLGAVVQAAVPQQVERPQPSTSLGTDRATDVAATRGVATDAKTEKTLPPPVEEAKVPTRDLPTAAPLPLATTELRALTSIPGTASLKLDIPEVRPSEPEPAREPGTGNPEPGTASEASLARTRAEDLIRTTLAGYEAAYSTLNVSGVRAVWPSVNASLLSRAFDGLQSQRFALGRCTVSIEGVAAQADCAGSATWTPKIGGGTQIEARRWHFELRNVAGAWQIVRAETR